MPTLALLGDVMLGRGVNGELARRAPEWFWGSVGPALRATDGAIANLECAVTTRRRPWRRTPKVFHFRADPAAIDVLRAGNVRCVSLANNHVLDFETEGLLDTLEYLRAGGIARVGAGRDLEDAREPALFPVGGVTVGVLAGTDNEPAFAAAHDRPGTHYFEIDAAPTALDDIAVAAAALRRRGAQVVVLSIHWGPNMVQVPPALFRQFARAVVARGVDLVHGHSAHVFQGVEHHDGALVLYDTGDVLDDYAVHPVLRNDWSFVFLVDVRPDGRLERLTLVPVRLAFARVDLATGADAGRICTRMRALSRDLGTELAQSGESLELRMTA